MTSASASATVHVPFRVFHITEGIYPDSPIALGRSHASWFLISTRPDGLAGFRVVRCLNTIIPGDRSTVGLFSAAGRHLFAVGGTFGEKAVNHLTHLRDTEGRAPVKVVQTYPKDHSFGFCALVEVHVPDEELMYACARCGRWETELGPRFQRCSGCKSRCYCSAKVSRRVHLASPHPASIWNLSHHTPTCSIERNPGSAQHSGKLCDFPSVWHREDVAITSKCHRTVVSVLLLRPSRRLFSARLSA